MISLLKVLLLKNRVQVIIDRTLNYWTFIMLFEWHFLCTSTVLDRQRLCKLFRFWLVSSAKAGQHVLWDVHIHVILQNIQKLTPNDCFITSFKRILTLKMSLPWKPEEWTSCMTQMTMETWQYNRCTCICKDSVCNWYFQAKFNT